MKPAKCARLILVLIAGKKVAKLNVTSSYHCVGLSKLQFALPSIGKQGRRPPMKEKAKELGVEFFFARKSKKSQRL